MAGIPFRTILCALTIALSLSSVTAKPGPKINQYARRTRPTSASCDYKSWWKSCLFGPLAKHFEVIDSAHTLLRGLKKNNGYGTGFPSAPRTTKPRVAVSEPASAVSSHTRPTQKMDSFRSTSTPESLNPTPTTGSESDWSVVRKNLHRLETEACGVSLITRIFGGDETTPGEFPWLALIFYKERFGPDVLSKCGGSLINDRYVLTAAHCLMDYRYILKYVRLGEYNTKMDMQNCSRSDDFYDSIFEFESCRAEPPRDYEVFTFKYHHMYKYGMGFPHDIGLIRLKKRVQFTKYILPVCLPVGELKARWNDQNFGANLTVAGWGNTEDSANTGSKSPVPLQANVPLMDLKECEAIWKMLMPGQLCAGDSKGGSPCHGDSGGPLVMRSMMKTFEEDNDVEGNIYAGYTKSIQIGIVSFGTRLCKIQPTVFTSVEEHLPWILKNLKP